jgi:hypothetical protein
MPDGKAASVPYVHMQMLASIDTHATGMPLLDAQADFRRARRAQRIARVGRSLRRRRGCRGPRAATDAVAVTGGVSRLEVIALRSIVGTVEPTVHFDERFRPASEVLRGRWERIALAHRRGQPLPAIVVSKRRDGYYVLDGRHRVSVALALGHEDIDAWVTGGAR